MNSNDKAVRLDRRQAMLGLGAATALGASYPLFAQTGPIKVGGSDRKSTRLNSSH